VLRQALEQQEVLLLQGFLDTTDDSAIVDRVLDLVGVRGLAVRIADLDVELDGLRNTALPFVDADQCFHPEVLDEYDVHGAVS